MKILHCIHTLNPQAGGVRDFVEQVASAQNRFDFEVEIATLDAADAPWCRQFPAVVHALGPGFLKFGYSQKWIGWIKANARRFDVIVINGIWQFHSFGTWMALQGFGVPYVVFPHGMLDRWFASHYPLKQLKKSLYWKLAEHRVLESAKAVLFSTQDECDRARGIFSPYLINEAVVSEPSADAPANLELCREEFFGRFTNLRQQRFLLFLGRLHEKKGCDLLISAFARFSALDPDLDLVIAGPDNGFENQLRAQVTHLDEPVRRRITFTGMLEESRWGAVSAAEALVLPSHQENYGRVVPEALSCGTPVLISDQVSLWQQVAESKAGLVCKDNWQGVEEMLRHFIELSPQEKLEMRGRARELFVSQFHSDNFFPKYLSLLSQISGANLHTRSLK